MSDDKNKPDHSQQEGSISFDQLMEEVSAEPSVQSTAPSETVSDMSSEDLADQSLEALLADDEVMSDAPVEVPAKEIQVKAADTTPVPNKKDPFPLLDDVTEMAPSLDIADEDEDLPDLSAPTTLETPQTQDTAVETAPIEAPTLSEVAVDAPVEAKEESTFQGLELDIALEDELEMDDIDEELPDLDAETTAFNMDEQERKMEEKFFKDTLNLATSDLYTNVLQVLHDADDIGIDATAKARIAEAQKLRKLPQLVCRELVQQKVITPVQLARSVARTLRRKEITSFLNIPQEAVALRTQLDSRVCGLLREARVIPLWHRVKAEDNLEGLSEIHLAHESSTRNLVLEAAISEYLPEHKFIWHFALRDVCGMFWLSGEEGDVDASMEAEALLDRIVGNAVDARSSDIHVDPSIKGEYKAIVRYRIDGYVQSKEVITLDQLERLRVRIENVARMPKVDLSHPNKGAFTRGGYDWRVQIQPHAGRQGPLPRIVIRRLNPDVMGMEELGYPEYFVQQVKEAAKSPNGLIFWTGPTGSGKTESIHSAIVSVNPMGRGLSVHTIEDPPEKRVPGYAVQMEIMETDPMRTALELLKSSLRADPDVVVFGEVRDAHLAKLVFEAANTGHLVFTTLHTNTSLDAIVRLDELGVNGFNLSYVRGIAAQKLVRRLCSHCKQPVLKPDEYTKYVFDKFGVELQGSNMYTHDPSGCPSCNHSGYHGRIAIAEWLVPNKELVDASAGGDFTDIEDIARRAGWKPMGYMATLHVKNGITDIHEIAAKVQELAGDLEG